MMTDKTSMTKPIVFYDGGCPLCRREIAHYQRIVEDGQVQWIDIMDSGDELQAHGLTWQKAMQRIHVQNSNGHMVSGVAAFASLWRHIPRYRFLAALITLPGVHWIAEQGYTVFARRRYRSRCNDQVCAEL